MPRSDKNPYVVGEKWKYWRKIHAVRFTYRDGTKDRSMALMLRYDQVHRISSGPSSLRPPPYEVPLGPDGQLYSTVVGRIPRR